MKSFKKIFALTAAVSMLAGFNILSVSASEHSFDAVDTTAGITIEQITVSLDELAAANYQVPVMVKVNPNPGVNALEFGVRCDLEYTTITKSKELKNYEDLATAGDSIADGLDAAMTIKASSVEPGLTWMTFAAADVDPDLSNFVTLLVTVPSDAKAGDEYPIYYAEAGAGGASKNIFQVKGNGTTTDYIELNDFAGSDGFIKIEGGTTTETATTTTEITTETTITETTFISTTTAMTSKSTTSNITTPVPNSTTQKPITTTNQNTTSSKVNMTTSNTNSSSTTTTTNKNGASPKTGGSDVLPIAGAGAAVAVLGGIALVAKKKN